MMSRKRPRLGTVHEAAEILGLNDRTIRRMLADGRLHSVDPPGVRVKRIDLDEVEGIANGHPSRVTGLGPVVDTLLVRCAHDGCPNTFTVGGMAGWDIVRYGVAYCPEHVR